MALGRIRTDLALETKEKFEEDNVEIRGVIIEEDYNEEKDIRTTTVKIETENGAKAMGRPQGVYITLEAPNMSVPDEDYHREISKELAKHIRKLVPMEKELTALVVGLGNREVTPDALGPDVVSNLRITRHVIQEYGVQSMGREYANSISGLVPGVMAQTGMETLGVKVIGIGVPTVVDAATIVQDSMAHLLDTLEESEKKEFLEEMIAPSLHSMFVTPKDVDETVKRLSYTISEGLNMAFEQA